MCKIEHKSVLYILTSIQVVGTPNTGQNLLLQHILLHKVEKRKKSKHIVEKLSKKSVFEFAPKCWLRIVFPEKHVKYILSHLAWYPTMVHKQNKWLHLQAPHLGKAVALSK